MSNKNNTDGEKKIEIEENFRNAIAENLKRAFEACREKESQQG